MNKDKGIVLRNWIKNSEKIIFWGASNRARGIIERIIDEYDNINIYGVVDNNYTGVILVKETPVNVYGWEHYQGTIDLKIVLLQTVLRSFRDIRLFLEDNGYVENVDYLDYEDCVNPLEFQRDKYFYSNCTVYSAYAPWENDIEFLNIYKNVTDYTLVDVYRMYELWEMAKQSANCESGNILEVGVWRGGTGTVISAAARISGIDEPIYLADTFSGVVKTSEHDNKYIGGEHNDTNVELVSKLLNDNGLDNVHLLKGVYPDDFMDDFKSTQWRFVHIDVDAYQSAKDIFNYCWKNVVRRGCVVFDDYGCNSTSGITDVCNELREGVRDCVFSYNLNGHGIFIKV